MKIQLKINRRFAKRNDGRNDQLKNKNKSVVDLEANEDYTDEELFEGSDSESDDDNDALGWSLFKSVFRGRERHSESRDFYDREDWLRSRMLDIDGSACCQIKTGAAWLMAAMKF